MSNGRIPFIYNRFLILCRFALSLSRLFNRTKSLLISLITSMLLLLKWCLTDLASLCVVFINYILLHIFAATHICTSCLNYCSIGQQKVECKKAKLSIYRSIYISTLSYGHEVWLVTTRSRLRKQAAEISFLSRVAGLSLRDTMRSSASGRGSE